MESFVKSLGINKSGYYDADDNYIIDIENSNEYGTIFNKLDKSELLDDDEDNSTVTIFSSDLAYESDDYIINLIADFEKNTYKLIIKDR